MDDARLNRAITIDPSTNRTYHYWKHLRARCDNQGRSTVIALTGRSILLAECASIRRKFCSILMAAARLRQETTVATLGPYAAAKCRDLHEERGQDTRRDVGRRRAALPRPSSQTIIYEMHVRGFTQASKFGRWREETRHVAGLIEKIPYLKELGITAVELLPVFQFDPQDCSAGQDQLLGLRADLLLCATPGV